MWEHGKYMGEMDGKDYLYNKFVTLLHSIMCHPNVTVNYTYVAHVFLKFDRRTNYNKCFTLARSSLISFPHLARFTFFF